MLKLNTILELIVAVHWFGSNTQVYNIQEGDIKGVRRLLHSLTWWYLTSCLLHQALNPDESLLEVDATC